METKSSLAKLTVKVADIQLKALIITLLLWISSLTVSSQSLTSISDSILKDGLTLYYLELAGIQASNFIHRKLSMEGLTGSFAYMDSDTVKVIFYKGYGRKKEVRYTFNFSQPVKDGSYTISGEPRKFTPYEKTLLKIKMKIIKKVNKEKEIRATFEEALLNTVFTNIGGSIQAYLLSGLQISGVVPLGNDYLMRFSNKGKLLETNKLHDEFIPIKGQVPDAGPDAAYYTMHKHSESNSPYITSTDICTLLLYKELVGWHRHFIFSDSHVSIFDMDEQRLLIMTKEDFDMWQNK